MSINFKEYTRMRDIVRKRNIRLAEQGLSPLVHFPTVKEIRSGFTDPGEALRAVKNYLSGGSTVKAVKATGLVPEAVTFPEMPKEKRLSSAEQKQRKRDWNRAYRQRQRLRQEALSPEQAKKHVSYLKALDTVSQSWKRQGFDIGIDLKSLTPKEAQAFVEYMDYRFSQGDFTQMYVIDEFIQDFSKLLNKGHKANEIVNDFNQFMLNRTALEERANDMTGISSGKMYGLWDEFINVMR